MRNQIGAVLLLFLLTASSAQQQAAKPVFIAGGYGTAKDQQTSSAMAILEKTRNTYHSLKSIWVEGITVTDLRGASLQSRTEQHFEAAFVAPAKLHVETKHSVTDVLFVSDGQTGVLYSPLTKTYTKVDVAVFRKPQADSSEEEHNSVKGFAGATGMVFDLFQSAILAGVKDAKIMNDEDLEFEGQKVRCWVIRAEYTYSNSSESVPLVRTYWIDKTRNIVLRERFERRPESIGPDSNLGDLVESASTVTRLSLNEPVPDGLFVFEPPEGAKEAGPSQPSIR
jgi:outer membrane lipoprotein-sorting protein